MNYIKKLKNLFLYAGVEKEEYDRLLPNIHEGNKLLLKIFSWLAGVMFFLLFMVSLFYQGFASANSTAYFASGMIMLAILICVQWVVPKKPALVTILVYIFEIVLYAFGIRISMLHADRPAVSAVAFLLVSPLLFYDRPIRLSALITAVTAVFSVMVSYLKEPDIVAIDIWNMITFAVVAIASTLFIMSIKLRALVQAVQIDFLSKTDLLTGLKNRNHYESRIQGYPGKCSSNVICVYGDVNGLHELNNREGHQAGDKMLREVAGRIQSAFGADDTYRIGGDEFVAFRTDGQLDDVIREVDCMIQELGRQGYHVSFGVSCRDKSQEDIDMNALIKEAENKMYSAKEDYYSRPENIKRSR